MLVRTCRLGLSTVCTIAIAGNVMTSPAWSETRLLSDTTGEFLSYVSPISALSVEADDAATIQTKLKKCDEERANQEEAAFLNFYNNMPEEWLKFPEPEVQTYNVFTRKKIPIPPTGFEILCGKYLNPANPKLFQASVDKFRNCMSLLRQPNSDGLYLYVLFCKAESFDSTEFFGNKLLTELREARIAAAKKYIECTDKILRENSMPNE